MVSRLTEFLASLGLFSGQREPVQKEIAEFTAKVEAHEKKLDRWEERQRRLAASSAKAGRALKRRP